MQAPELIISKWLNSDSDLKLEHLRGKVVVIHAFQMLCPACVHHGVPQAQRVFDIFNDQHVVVIGLHTVFEHHEAMQEKSLAAFLHEFRIQFPVAIDEPSDQGSIPKTMKLYDMQGTPTWILIDRTGEVRTHIFGQMEDLILGAEISKLALESNKTNVNIYKRKSKGN
jgi:thiol-disulfide isomerase/thioredoxin